MIFGGEIIYDENDDNDKRGSDGEMPALRPSVGEADAGSAQSLPELQADEMGRAEQVDDQGYVYFFETEDAQFIKIGFAVNVDRRIGQVSPLVPMRLIGYFPASPHTELWIQGKFKEDRHIGDWFRTSPELRQFIESLGVIVLPKKKEELARPPKNMAKRKNPAAVALARRRMKTMTAEERADVARQGGKASKANQTAEERTAIARKAGQASAAARWGKKKAK